MIALFIPNNAYQNLHLHEFPLIKENKYKIGAVSKYDIPQYIREIPEEYSAFCTIKEAGKLKNIKIREEKDKKKKIQMELEINNNKKDKENNTSSNIIKNKNNKNNSKNINITADKKGNFNNNIEELEEPIPNEMHKYCHLCKKQFDNYLRHIYSKNHKDNTLKYTDTFKSIKNVFNRINTFWENKKDNNESNINSTTTSHNLNEIEEKIEFESDTNNNENLKLKLFSQFNQGTRDGCKAKKRLISSTNSQLSTCQSFPIFPPKKRKKNDIKELKDKSKSKIKKQNNKSINEFLIRGEYVNIKKNNDEKFNFL